MAGRSSFFYWLLFYCLLWWLIAGGQGWAFGLPIIALAAYLAVRLQLQLWRLRLLQVPSLLWFLMRAMFSGACDVARRALSPSCIIAPHWASFTLTAEDWRVRYLVSLIIGLLPGTLASRIVRNQLQIHVLDERMPWRDTVAELERRLALLIIARDV